MASKWKVIYGDTISARINENENLNPIKLAEELLGYGFKSGNDVDLLRTYIVRVMKKRAKSFEVKSISDTKGYPSPVPENLLKSWCEQRGIPYDMVKSAKYITHGNNDTFNVVLKDGKTFDTNEFADDLIAHLKAYSPQVREIKREIPTSPHCLVIDIADLHIGKLATENGTGEKYNVKKAIKRAHEGVDGILNKSAGFKFDKIFLPIGNDVLHTDGLGKATTSGTPQDTDGMWYDNFNHARDMYIEVIEKLVTVADVHVVHCPSNHDYVIGFALAAVIEAYFSSSKNVTFDVTNRHRKYVQYGANLIGFSHGDASKTADKPLLMANEAKEIWAKTDYRYSYLHHVHHKDVVKFQSAKEYQGVTVEFLRSPSATDMWHSQKGYQHAIQAIEGFIHSYKHGQVARISHNFRS